MLRICDYGKSQDPVQYCGQVGTTMWSCEKDYCRDSLDYFFILGINLTLYIRLYIVSVAEVITGQFYLLEYEPSHTVDHKNYRHLKSSLVLSRFMIRVY